MINATLIWFMLLPIAFGLGLWWFIGRNLLAAQWAGAFTAAAVIITGAAFFGASGHATADVEIWNGKITGQERIHGSYQRSYDCMCSTDSKGNRSCSTCYEDHYTVNWVARSTIGDIAIADEDSTSRSIYQTPDPARYRAIVIGEPCSKAHTYTNYVQAVPGSLFTPSASSLKAQFKNLLPAYPDQVHDIYRATHFVTAGYNTPDASMWNVSIANLLKERGPTKQVNAIVVIAKTDDPNYVFALRDAWDGANKNDVVLVIGSATWPKIDFVEVISWTKNELFKIQLRDAVKDIGMIQREPIVAALAAQIDTNFERRRMREFKYLEADIDPPTWMLAGLVALMAIGAFATYLWFMNENGRFYRPRSYTNSLHRPWRK